MSIESGSPNFLFHHTPICTSLKKLYRNSHLCLYLFYSSPPPTPTSFKVFSVWFSAVWIRMFPKCGLVFVWLCCRCSCFFVWGICPELSQVTLVLSVINFGRFPVLLLLQVSLLFCSLFPLILKLHVGQSRNPEASRFMFQNKKLMLTGTENMKVRPRTSDAPFNQHLRVFG